MPRWLRVVRGMVGTGLTFAAGVGGLAATIGGIVWLGDGVTGREVLQIAGKSAVAAFLLGVGFAGVLAITARGRRFSKLSLRLVTGLGAGAGLLYFAVLAFNGGRSWSTRDAIANFVLLTLMGAGSAVATVMIARKARSGVDSGDELRSLGTGETIVPVRRRSKIEVPKS